MRTSDLSRVALVGALLLLVPGGDAAAPAANFAFVPREPTVGQSVVFTDSSDDPEGAITSWEWDFGDGGSATGRDVQHAFLSPGTFNVTLVVTDAEGLQGNRTRAVTVIPAPVEPETPRDETFGLPLWLQWAMPFLVTVVLLAIAALVIIKGQPIVYNRVFFLLYLASATKSLTEGLYALLGPQHPTYPTIANANAVSAYLYITIFLWFVLVFPRPVMGWLKNGIRGSVTLLLAVPFIVAQALGLPVVHIFNVYASVAAISALGLLVYHAWETDSHEERHRIRLLAITFFILVLTTIVITILQFLASSAEKNGAVGQAADLYGFTNVFALVITPVLEIIGAAILMYAILRYQFLGVDSFLKRATRATLFGVMVGTVFVIVGNSLENVLEQRLLGELRLGFIVAGFISAVSMYPVQKGAERIANRLFPEANASAAQLSLRRMEIYEAQLRYALLDRQLKEKEMTMLAALRDSIDITPDEIRQVAKKFPGLRPEFLLARPPSPSSTPAG